MGGIFISHTHSDQKLAEAIADLIEKLFDKRVSVNFSSKKELDGGIAPGESWFQWIVDQVKVADLAFVLLTPTSVQKPWVLWESGAVAGAAFATSADKARVIPMTFRIKTSEVPTPFASTQLITGTDHADMNKLIDDLLDRFGQGLSARDARRIGDRSRDVLGEYLNNVSTIMNKVPFLVTESAIQEWLSRLDSLEKEERFSEASIMESWLDVSFGRDADDRQRPLDLRLHRRLGELYAAGAQPADATRQFELARQLAPRDIFILRRLGKAYLDQNLLNQAETIIKEIETLDPTAFTRNAENAALKSRFYEQSDNKFGALDVLETAFKGIPQSYYIGDRYGQALIAQGDLEKAKRVYAQVLQNIDDLREQNIWSHATALTAAVVQGDQARIEAEIQGLRDSRRTRGDLESIERGISKILAKLGNDSSVLDKLRGMEARA